jgi:hypothetical protein
MPTAAVSGIVHGGGTSSVLRKIETALSSRGIAALEELI